MSRAPPRSGGATSQLDLCVTGAIGVVVEDYDGNTVQLHGTECSWARIPTRS